MQFFSSSDSGHLFLKLMFLLLFQVGLLAMPFALEINAIPI